MKKGFTLIELAIVFVIVGLVITGVLAGRDLIDRYSIYKIRDEIKQYSQSTVFFRDKFKCFPGDFNRAEAFWGSGNTDDGDCDGQIEEGAPYEILLFWDHLFHAGYFKEELTPAFGSRVYGGENVPGSYAGDTAVWYPVFLPAAGVATIITDVVYEGNTLMLAKKSNATFGLANSALSAHVTYTIDKKFDDGLAWNGDFIAVEGADATAGDCITNSGGVAADYNYNIANEEVSCKFYLKLPTN